MASKARWVTPRARWVTLKSRWVTQLLETLLSPLGEERGGYAAEGGMEHPRMLALELLDRAVFSLHEPELRLPGGGAGSEVTPLSHRVSLTVSLSPSLPLCLASHRLTLSLLLSFAHRLYHCVCPCVSLTLSPTVSLSPSLPLCLASHRLIESPTVSPTVSPSPCLLLVPCLSLCLSHRVSHCVTHRTTSLTLSSTVSPAPSPLLCLASHRRTVSPTVSP